MKTARTRPGALPDNDPAAAVGAKPLRVLREQTAAVLREQTAAVLAALGLELPTR
jgi:hypothetical protein